VDAPPRASDESPTISAAAPSAEAWRGPEEFIAPPVPMAATMPPPANPQPTAASGEEELMWLGDEFEAADLEVAAQGWRSPGAASPAQATPPALELSDAELAQLAEDEGWDVEEVEAIRRLLGRPSDAPPPSAAPREASDIPGQPARPGLAPAVDAAARPLDGPAAGTATPDLGIPGAREASPPAESASSSGLSEGGGGDPDQDWPQGRSGTAAEAYRRLRKLFPS
jgi:hypothetical protein